MALDTTGPAGELTITMNGRSVEIATGTSVLEAAKQMGVSIPTLCSYAGVSPYGACRVCIVEVETPRGAELVASCSYPVEDDLVVHTDTDRVRESRRTILELLLAQAPDSPELVEFARGFGVSATPFETENTGRCIMCGLCVNVCDETMGRSAIGIFGRGAARRVTTPFDDARSSAPLGPSTSRRSRIVVCGRTSPTTMPRSLRGRVSIWRIPRHPHASR
jgi:NADH dehydrogenase/NADH:ubiquinone oxidoreductase subunit G